MGHAPIACEWDHPSSEWARGGALTVYESGGLSVFKIFLFISQMFVMPSLIVATKIDLGFVPFLILCRDIKN